MIIGTFFITGAARVRREEVPERGEGGSKSGGGRQGKGGIQGAPEGIRATHQLAQGDWSELPETWLFSRKRDLGSTLSNT